MLAALTKHPSIKVINVKEFHRTQLPAVVDGVPMLVSGEGILFRGEACVIEMQRLSHTVVLNLPIEEKEEVGGRKQTSWYHTLLYELEKAACTQRIARRIKGRKRVVFY
jgi:hypothetical protein